METEVEKKEGRGADLGMIALGSKKENATMRLVGDEQVSNYERREPERKEGRGADRTDSRFERRETMMAATWIAMVAFTEFLNASASHYGKRNERVRPKKEQVDCVSRCAKLKFESSNGGIEGLVKCDNPTVEEDVEQLYIC